MEAVELELQEKDPEVMEMLRAVKGSSVLEEMKKGKRVALTMATWMTAASWEPPPTGDRDKASVLAFFRPGLYRMSRSNSDMAYPQRASFPDGCVDSNKALRGGMVSKHGTVMTIQVTAQTTPSASMSVIP